MHLKTIQKVYLFLILHQTVNVKCEPRRGLNYCTRLAERPLTSIRHAAMPCCNYIVYTAHQSKLLKPIQHRTILLAGIDTNSTTNTRNIWGSSAKTEQTSNAAKCVVHYEVGEWRETIRADNRGVVALSDPRALLDHKAVGGLSSDTKRRSKNAADRKRSVPVQRKYRINLRFSKANELSAVFTVHA